MTNLRRLRVLFALASGLSLAVAFPPYRGAWFAWFSLAALMFVSLGARWWVALLAGLLHGVAFYTGTLPWIYTVMRVHGHLEPAAATAVLALLVAYLALFPAAFALAVGFLGRASVSRACFAAPFLWVALEFGRTHVPVLGFPWNLLGYAAANQLGLLQLASLTGIYGLSFALAGYNALIVWLLAGRTRRAWLAWLAATVILVPVALVGHRFVPAQIPQRVAHLVQTNFPQSPSYPADWMERHAGDLDELERLSVAAALQGTVLTVPSGAASQKALATEGRSSLVIWPEVPAPFYLQDARFTDRMARIARSAQGHFLAGVVDWRPGPHGGLAPYNSAALVDPAGQRVFLYDKIHLVPFGEYVPLRRWLTFAGKLTADIGDYQPGSAYTVGELPDGKFGVLICFEAIFPAEVRRFVAGGAEVLVNISNDGWFGRSEAPEQHLLMSRVRAVENRRWLLRATNNGHTVSVDPYGRYAARQAPDFRGALAAPYDFRRDRSLYARLGDWWAWLCVVVAVSCFVSKKRK